METEKNTFVANGNQISNEWKQKKTFVPLLNEISKEWKRKKLKMKPGVHRCQTKCGYACSKCHVLKHQEENFYAC